MKAIHLFLFATSLLLLSSCEALMQGMAAGMGGMGYGGYGMGFGGVGTGNMDYLLDPRYAVAQVAQENAYFSNVFNGLATHTVNQVKNQEQTEYQQLLQFEPDLTFDEFRWRKTQAQTLMKEAERGERNVRYKESSSVPSYSGSGCRSCHGTGKCRGYQHASVTLLNLYCGGDGRCTKCYGKRVSTNEFGSTGSCTQCRGTGKCHMCGGSGQCSTCGGRGR